MAAKRIAVLGFSLESNRFAPPCGEADFRERSFLVGEEICLDARAEHPAHDLSLTGFYADMDAACGGAGGLAGGAYPLYRLNAGRAGGRSVL